MTRRACTSSVALVSEQGHRLFKQEIVIEQPPGSINNLESESSSHDTFTSHHLYEAKSGFASAPMDDSTCRVAASTSGLVNSELPFSFCVRSCVYSVVRLPGLPFLLVGNGGRTGADTTLRLLWLGHVMTVLFEEELSKLAHLLRQRSEDAIHHATFHESVGHADPEYGGNLLKLLGDSEGVETGSEECPVNVHLLNLFLDSFVQPCLSFPDLTLLLMAPLLNWTRRREQESSVATKIYSVKMLIFSQNLLQHEPIDIFSSNIKHRYQSAHTEPLLMELLPLLCRGRSTGASSSVRHVLRSEMDILVIIVPLSYPQNAFLVAELSTDSITDIVTGSYLNDGAKHRFPCAISPGALPPALVAAWAAVEDRCAFLFADPSSSSSNPTLAALRHEVSRHVGGPAPPKSASVIHNPSPANPDGVSSKHFLEPHGDNESFLRGRFASLACYLAPVDKSAMGYIRPTPPPPRPRPLPGAPGALASSSSSAVAAGRGAVVVGKAGGQTGVPGHRRIKAAVSRPRPPPNPV